MLYALTFLAACAPRPAEAPIPEGLPPAVIGGFNREDVTAMAAEMVPDKAWLIFPSEPEIGQKVKVQVSLDPNLQQPSGEGEESYSWSLMGGDIVQVHGGGTVIVADVTAGVERPAELDGFWLVTLELREEHAKDGPWLLTGMERYYPYGRVTELAVDLAVTVLEMRTGR